MNDKIEKEEFNKEEKIKNFFTYFKNNCPEKIIGKHLLDDKRVCIKCDIKSNSSFILSRKGLKYYEKYLEKYEKIYIEKEIIVIFNKIVIEKDKKFYGNNKKNDNIKKEFTNFIINEIKSQNQINIIINKIFNNIISENTYVHIYASFCSELSNFNIKGEKYSNDVVKSYNQHRYKKISFKNNLIKISMEKNYKLLNIIIKEKRNNNNIYSIKRHFINSTLFIGELFNYDMIHINLLDYYIGNLINLYLKNEHEVIVDEIIVSVCNILTLCGSKLNSNIYINRLNYYFNLLSTIKKSCNTRIKYLIMDLEDLKKCNWKK